MYYNIILCIGPVHVDCRSEHTSSAAFSRLLELGLRFLSVQAASHLEKPSVDRCLHRGSGLGIINTHSHTCTKTVLRVRVEYQILYHPRSFSSFRKRSGSAILLYKRPPRAGVQGAGFGDYFLGSHHKAFIFTSLAKLLPPISGYWAVFSVPARRGYRYKQRFSSSSSSRRRALAQ